MKQTAESGERMSAPVTGLSVPLGENREKGQIVDREEVSGATLTA